MSYIYLGQINLHLGTQPLPHNLNVFWEKCCSIVRLPSGTSPIQSSHQSTPYYNLGNFHFKKVITTHNLAQKDRQCTNYKILLIKIYQVEIVSVKSDRKTLWALQRSCNDQRSAKLTVSSEEGKLIAILAAMSTSTSIGSLSSRSASGWSIHLLQKESERCFLKYFWTLPILEIFHSSDVSCLFLPGFTKHNQTCEKERKLTFWCPNSLHLSPQCGFAMLTERKF